MFDKLLLILADLLNCAVLAFAQFARVFVFLFKQIKAPVVRENHAADPPNCTGKCPHNAGDNPKDPVIDH